MDSLLYKLKYFLIDHGINPNIMHFIFLLFGWVAWVGFWVSLFALLVTIIVSLVKRKLHKKLFIIFLSLLILCIITLYIISHFLWPLFIRPQLYMYMPPSCSPEGCHQTC
jgi:MFS-type transporter involved in bile tolerance (Atg22 family)